MGYYFRNIKNHGFVRTLESYNNPSINGLVSIHRDDHCGLLLKLIELSVIDKDAGGKLWAQCLGFTYVNPLQSVAVPGAVADGLPIELCEEYCALHLYTLNGIASVCMSDPSNERDVAFLQKYLNKKVSPSFGLPFLIEKAASPKRTFDKSDPGKELVSQERINNIFRAKRKRTRQIVFKECA